MNTQKIKINNILLIPLCIIPVFIICSICSVSAYGQITAFKIDSVCASKKIELITYKHLKADSLVEAGIVVRRVFIECDVSIQEGEYVFGFGNQHTRVPRMSFMCIDNQTGKTFNGRVKGKKVGIWFGWYFWGAVRKATMYEQGKIVRIVYFRPNGNLSRVMYYKNGIKRRRGHDHYTKEGYIKGPQIGSW